jgi:hypothetical protein
MSCPVAKIAAAVVFINHPGVSVFELSDGAGLNGITAHPTKLSMIIANGAIRKITVFDLLGMTISLHNSFNPSASGCKSPKIPTTFGPRRR